MAVGTRLSAGVYRAPNGGIFRSTTGTIPHANTPATPRPRDPVTKPAGYPQTGQIANGATPGAATGFGGAVNQTGQAGGTFNGGGNAQAGTASPGTSNPVANTDPLNALRQQRHDLDLKFRANRNDPNYLKQRDAINKQIIAGKAQPAAQNPAANTPANTPADPSVTDPNKAQVDEEQIKTIMSQLFPGANLPQDYQGSDTYKWQMNEGQKLIDRKLAAQGLNNSGAELEAMNELSGRVGAAEQERLSSLQQTQADRLFNLLNNNADRSQREADSNKDFYMRNLELAQQNNPMQYIMTALQNSASLTKEQQQQFASFLRDQYQRVYGGGGASAGPAPSFMPPLPSGPDYSGINAMGSMFGGQNNNGLGKSFMDSLPGLIKGVGSFFGSGQ